MMEETTQNYAEQMLEFIEQSPSSFHAVAQIKERLREGGFRQLSETESWSLEMGKGYFVERNGSSVIAFRIPDKEHALSNGIKGFHIIAAHSDSPTFKIKEKPELSVDGHYVRLNTEKYGGMILSTWFDRPLSIAGRIAYLERKNPTENPRERILTKLVNVEKDLCVIPNVAIHLERDMNKGVEYNPQVDLLPLFADCSGQDGGWKDLLLREVAESAGILQEEILGQDLFLYVREKGRLLGLKGEFVCSPRLDDLQCVYASLTALLESSPKEFISVCAVFDNEEVGSGTRQGADSTFLEEVLVRIGDSLNEKGEKDWLQRRIADSFLISADNAHAVHPNHPEKSDPTNRPYLNGGIVIKYHGSQKYTTDGVTAACMKNWCRRAEVPFQTYANRSDIAGGSTLGNISTAHVSVPSVDVGLPQLSMHSAVETGGRKDTEYAVRVFRLFYGE